MNDTIIRVAERNGSYVVYDKEILRNPNISFRAKGLFSFFMALPSNWTIRLDEIRNHATEGRDALRTAFNELVDAGYAKRVPKRDEGGHMTGSEILIHEVVNKEAPIKRVQPKRTAVHKKRTAFVRPTPEEVSAYAKTIDFELDGAKFVDYYTARDWEMGKSGVKMKNWQASVRTWKSNQTARVKKEQVKAQRIVC